MNTNESSNALDFDQNQHNKTIDLPKAANGPNNLILNEDNSVQDHTESLFNCINMLNERYDIETAKRYKLAADQGDIKSMFNYAGILLSDEDVETNKEEAAQYLKLAADQGDVKSMNDYAIMLFIGEGVEVVDKLAVKYFKLAADQGEFHSMLFYSEMLRLGYSLEPNEELSLKYYNSAVQQTSEEEVCNYLNLFLRTMDDRDRKQAYKCKILADQGDIKSICNYGLMLINGTGV